MQEVEPVKEMNVDETLYSSRTDQQPEDQEQREFTPMQPIELSIGNPIKPPKPVNVSTEIITENKIPYSQQVSTTIKKVPNSGFSLGKLLNNITNYIANLIS